MSDRAHLLESLRLDRGTASQSLGIRQARAHGVPLKAIGRVLEVPRWKVLVLARAGRRPVDGRARW